MNLREALDLCTDAHSDAWVRLYGAQSARPATAMVAGLFDPGTKEPRMRPLVGHTMAVYEPDARLSLVWTVPDDDEEVERRADWKPEWTENDTHEWKHARGGWVVVLLGGAPIWQELVWYLDWGSGVGGYVPNFQARFGDRDAEGTPQIEGWETSAWAVGLARLINAFSATGDFISFDPTPRLVPSPSPVHPVGAARGGY